MRMTAQHFGIVLIASPLALFAVFYAIMILP